MLVADPRNQLLNLIRLTYVAKNTNENAKTGNLIAQPFQYKEFFEINTFTPRVNAWSYKVVLLTFESVDEMPWCNHPNKTSLVALLHSTICFVCGSSF